MSSRRETLSKYIHLNPVKAALSKMPQEYKWSSYAFYCIGDEAPSWLKTDWLTDYFGPDIDESRRNYREFVEMDMDEEFEYPYERVVAQAILGNEGFVKEILAKTETSAITKSTTGRNLFSTQINLNEIYRAVCSHFGLDNLIKPAFGLGSEELRGKARKVFIYLARSYTCSSNREIAEMIGDMGRTGVSECFRRLAKEMGENKQSAEA